MARPFRFGYQTYSASSGQEWRDKARQAEDLGYSCFFVADHYLGPGPALTAMRHPVQDVAAIPAMAVAAEVTDTIRIGARVMCIDYRNPVVLAKELATLDFFSDGRLEAGLGAGWLEGEYHSMGVPFDSAGTRIARLADVIKMMKVVMADGEAAFVGESGVRATEFEGLPKPVQKPHPPIMVGGGSPKVLRLAGAEADIVSFNFNNRAGVIGPDGVGELDGRGHGPEGRVGPRGRGRPVRRDRAGDRRLLHGGHRRRQDDGRGVRRACSVSPARTCSSTPTP